MTRENSPYLDNPVIRWNFIRMVKSRADLDLSEKDIDPDDSWSSNVERVEKQFHCFLGKFDDRPIGPDGTPLKEEKHCLNCRRLLPYKRITRKFCDNKGRCKKAYQRKRERERKARLLWETHKSNFLVDDSNKRNRKTNEVCDIEGYPGEGKRPERSPEELSKTFGN